MGGWAVNLSFHLPSRLVSFLRRPQITYLVMDVPIALQVFFP
jgi:hypothetical protein